ncbi:hypothetical protein [Bacillus sp. UMB0728]|uniref:hypothetical protein n=1 Tax=Bacillus sp. UMB0728 TaxID=2066052 RepID=UPI0011590BF9|nr:hypothetical protein [Bacillus sp. UMB0728]
MGIVVEKQWHKITLIAITIYFSLIFTTIFLPAMWIHYRIPTIDYYLNSFVIMLLGGVLFNIVLSTKYHAAKRDLDNGIPRGFVIKVFGGKLIAYMLLFVIMASLTGDIIPYLYLMIFLMSGGFVWFCTLRGYIHAKNNKEKGENEEYYNPWLGRLLFSGIALSLLLGYLYLTLIE